jgi:hypothetical protein
MIFDCSDVCIDSAIRHMFVDIICAFRLHVASLSGSANVVPVDAYCTILRVALTRATICWGWKARHRCSKASDAPA